MAGKEKSTSAFTWTVGEAARALSGELLCGSKDQPFSGVSIDSRRISADELFVAIEGQVHDGHSYTDDVVGQGIRVLVVERSKARDLPWQAWQRSGVACIAVTDTTGALGDLASFARRRASVSVVAITGSNGKTTTRGMAAGILSLRFRTLTAKENYNNLIGLPLTLLDLDRTHEWAVLELGMSRPGEIGRLGGICLPDIGLITNIGPAHLGGLQSIEGVAAAKAELLGTVRAEGTVVLNADDPRLLILSRREHRQVLLFGLSEGASVRGTSLRQGKRGTAFVLTLPTESVEVELPLAGSFMVSNALAAAAIGYRVGLTAGEIKQGLEAFRPAKGRMNVLSTAKHCHIIDDAYNANPVSMEAAIRTLGSLRGKGRGFVVAGDMLELGDSAESMHRAVGSLVARSGASRLYSTGDFAEAVASGAAEDGMGSEDIFTGTREEIFTDLKVRIRSGDWVLIKGSRAMGMEKIVEWLRDWADS